NASAASSPASPDPGGAWHLPRGGGGASESFGYSWHKRFGDRRAAGQVGEHQRADQLGGKLFHVCLCGEPALGDADRDDRFEGLVLVLADPLLEVGDLRLVRLEEQQ